MRKNIVFTGHMIDRQDRLSPRFPQFIEENVRKLIRSKLNIIMEDGPIYGIASAACGGDILFHEVCQELNINSEIFLPFTPLVFRKGSVDFAGSDWSLRFERLIDALPVSILKEQERNDEDRNPYTLTNDFMLRYGIKGCGTGALLLALWNGETGDGEGGTHELVENAKQLGFSVEIIPLY